MSAGTLIVRRLENQIILKYLEACKWKDLYRTASIIQGYLWSVQDSKHHSRLPMFCTGQQASFKATYDLYRTASIIQGYLCSVQDSKHHSRLPMFCTGQHTSFKATYVLYRTASIIQGYLCSVQDSKHHSRLTMSEGVWC